MAERDIHAPDEQGFIPSVFNYCDRRCERCRFVRQCRVGIVEVDDVDPDHPSVGDERVEDYEERLRKIMGMGGEQDQDDEEEGVHFELDPEDLKPDPDFQREQAEIRRHTNEHVLSKLGNAYTDLVSGWMEPREAVLAEKGYLSTGRRTAVAMVGGSVETQLLTEAFDEILWFQHMLFIKIGRAVSGKIEDPDWMAEYGMDPLQGDWNGTAKLCLHITERCIAAWSAVAHLLPHEKESTDLLLLTLQRCEAELHAEFPDAEKFIRPGFDA